MTRKNTNGHIILAATLAVQNCITALQHTYSLWDASFKCRKTSVWAKKSIDLCSQIFSCSNNISNPLNNNRVMQWSHSSSASVGFQAFTSESIFFWCGCLLVWGYFRATLKSAAGRPEAGGSRWVYSSAFNEMPGCLLCFLCEAGFKGAMLFFTAKRRNVSL